MYGCMMQYGQPDDVLPERTLEEAGKYAAATKGIAARRQFPVLDLYTKLLELPDWHALQDDGLHFSQDGQGCVSELLLAEIETSFPKLW